MANLANSLERLGVDAARLSNRTGIALERVNQLIHGSQPTAIELRLIANYLKLPADALLRIEKIVGDADIRFRPTTYHKAPLTAEARIRELGKFLSRCKLLDGQTKQLQVSASLADRVSVEQAATAIRELLCAPGELLDPICDLVSRLDKTGIARTIVMKDLEVEGAASTVDGYNLIIIASRSFKPRMLFTCAHELAHLVLGHIKPDRWIIDEDTIESFDDEKEDERLCNVLASAILLPAQGVAKFLNLVRKQIKVRSDAISDTEILFLSRYFGTSFLAAAMRLEHLELLPTGSGFALEDAIRRDHQSAEAYAEALGLPPRNSIAIPALSLNIRQTFIDALSRGDISLGRTAETLGLSTIEMSNALA